MTKQEITKVVNQYMIPDLTNIVMGYMENPKLPYLDELHKLFCCGCERHPYPSYIYEPISKCVLMAIFYGIRQKWSKSKYREYGKCIDNHYNKVTIYIRDRENCKWLINKPYNMGSKFLEDELIRHKLIMQGCDWFKYSWD
jgi:hypothetical protein